MTFVEHLKAGAYRFRFAFLIIGWMWFCIGAAFMAIAGAYPEHALKAIIHALIDTAFGLAHLYLSDKCKNWKEFDNRS